MNSFSIFTLKVLHKVYTKVIPSNKVKPSSIQDPDKVSELIYNTLNSEKPCMIARFGSTELTCLSNYLGVKNNKGKYIDYIKGNVTAWWWNPNIINQMQNWSGFFPARQDKIEQFCELMLQDIPEVDILASWLSDELLFENELKNAQKIRLMYLDPYWTKVPWTKALKGKKILVLHPFAETIRKQYEKRELLFENQEILPEFESLTTIQAVQSIGMGDDRFSDWFEALNYMKAEIEKCDFDICLIGCGAYGFPLAAHVKRIGKKAVHVGGSLQLLFGIMGNRWDHDEPHYTEGTFIYYAGLQNIYWVRPSEDERPQNHQKVEGSCYW